MPAVRRSEKMPIRRNQSLPAAEEKIGTHWPARVTTLGAVDPGRAWRPTDHLCRRGTVRMHPCLPGDRRACHLPGVVRVCSSQGGTGMTHLRGATAAPCRGSLSLRQANGRGTGHPCHERHRQPGHPQFRQICAECGLTLLRRHVQGLPSVQEEVCFLPSQLPPGHADAGAVPTVP